MENIIKFCCERNKTVAGMLAGDKNITLEDLIDMQREKLANNRKIKPVQNPEVFYQYCYDHVKQRLGSDIAKEIKEGLSYGIMNIADHHGGLYSPQSFQGDMLFGRLLEKEGYRGRYTPIFSAGIVALGSSTYARGLLSFSKSDAPVQIPIFPRRQINQLVSLTKAYDAGLIKGAEASLDQHIQKKAERRPIRNLLRTVYADPEILNLERYGDQILHLGLRISQEALGEAKRPAFVYLEIEEILKKLFKQDIQDPKSLLSVMITDKKVLQALNKKEISPGCPLSGLMFRGIDENGRKFVLNLFPDGLLRGRDMRGKEIVLRASGEELVKGFQEYTLLPSGYLFAVMLAWARGITWLGGVFQSGYLPAWAEDTADILKECGYDDFADTMKAMDCSGYISGPIFALSAVEGGAVNAGPLEFIRKKPDEEKFSQWMDTAVYDSHLMGMFEFYNDLVPAKEKEEGWYETITKYVGGRFQGNLL